MMLREIAALATSRQKTHNWIELKKISSFQFIWGKWRKKGWASKCDPWNSWLTTLTSKGSTSNCFPSYERGSPRSILVRWNLDFSQVSEGLRLRGKSRRDLSENEPELRNETKNSHYNWSLWRFSILFKDFFSSLEIWFQKSYQKKCKI